MEPQEAKPNPEQTNPILNSIIQIAENKNMVVDGPLSKQCSDALLEIYKKEVDEETGISLETAAALESQVNDAIVYGSYWAAARGHRDEAAKTGKEVGLLYGVSAVDASSTDVVSISDHLADMSEVERQNSVIVIDHPSTDPDGIENDYVNAIGAMAAEHHVAFYTSLEAYKASVPTKDGQYKGKQTGNEVKYIVGDKIKKHKMKDGIRGTANVLVTIKGGKVINVKVV